MRIGSLFSGAGGLDMAVEAVFGGEVIWQSEVDKAASKVLAYRFPCAPNWGDITEIDWAAVEPVDILCGGYPCQPFSAAGQRKGTADDRHLWPYFAEAIRRLRPGLVVLENVAGHRSMGFDSVLADLAEARYDAQWCSVRASDVGAPHRRERLFILATDANSQRRALENDSCRRQSDVAGRCGRGESGGCGKACGCGANRGDVADTPRNRRYEGRPESAGQQRGSDAAVSGDGSVDLLPTPRSSDCFGAGQHGDGGMDLRTTVSLLPTPQSRDHKGTDSAADHNRRSPGMDAITFHTAQWGKYEPAIRRWEALTRPAPAPTEPNKNGNPRLSAAFSEWLMGWPNGWVTDPEIGISRNDQLRIIGNGVVPQQAAAALTWLLKVAEVAA